MSTKLFTPRTWIDTPQASRDPMSEFNVNRELHDMVDFLQNHPYVQVVGASNTLTTAVVTTLQWATPSVEDSDTMFSGSTSRLTCVLAGVYEVMACMLWSSNATGRRQNALAVNGNALCWRSQAANTGGGAATEVFIADDIRLAVGDYVEVQGFQDSGGNLAVNTNFGGDSYFSARWVRR